MATSICIKMATRGLVLVAFVVSVAYAQSRPIKVDLTSSTTVPTADIVKEMTTQCPKVTLTLDMTKADFMMEARIELKEGACSGPYKFTLFGQDGTAIFSTSTRRLRNAVKDMCGELKKHS